MGKSACLLALLLVVAAGAGFCAEWHLATPAPRSLPTLVVDSANQQGVMFAGGTHEHYLNDVWGLRLNQNTGYALYRIQTNGTPPHGRLGHSAICDPIGQRMMIFGGRDEVSARADLWALDLTTNTWQELHPAGDQPRARVFHSAIYHPGRRSMILFDGTDLGNAYDEVWELKLDTLKWCRLSIPGTHPSARWSYVLGLDRTENRLVTLYGQSGDSIVTDAWALDLTPGSERWTELNTTGDAPSPRSSSACCIDDAGRRVWLFGGYYYPPFTFYNELYCFDLDALVWSRVLTTNEQPWERRCAAGMYDPGMTSFVVFGGQGYETYFSDLWCIDLSTVGTKEWQGAGIEQTTPRLQMPAVASRQLRLRYFLPQPGDVRVRIVDGAGRVVRGLFSGKSEGTGGWLTWDGRDDNGKLSPAGSYFCYMETGQTGLSRKFVLTE